MSKDGRRTLTPGSTLKRQVRNLPFEVRALPPEEEGGPTLYEISVSSEAEVQRWFGIEVLDHSKAAVNMERMNAGAAVLLEHYSDQVGVVRKAWLAEKRLYAQVEFSRSQRGQEVERDVADKIRQNVSVGYRVDKAVLQEKREVGKNGRGDALYTDVWLVQRWTPLEVSFVGVPADASVGNRAEGEGGGEEFPVEVNDGGQAAEEESTMLRQRNFNGGTAGGGAPATTAEPAKPAVTITAEDTRRAEEQRATEIRTLCTTHYPAEVAQARAAEFIGSPLSIDQVSARIAASRASQGAAQPSAEAIASMTDDIPEADLARYSYQRAIRRAVEVAGGLSSNAKFDGVEARVHEHLTAKMQAMGAKLNGGILMPTRTSPLSARTLSSVQGQKGAELVPQRVGDLIDLLRAKARVLTSGAQLFTGLSGPVGFPKITGTTTVYWVPENPAADVTSSEPSLGLALLTPKTMQGNVPFTRQLLMQSSIDVEAWVKNELAIGHALAIDKAALHGKGNNGEPLGLYNTTGVYLKDFSSAQPDIVGLMDMVANIADKNADVENMRWIFTALMAGRLRVLTEFSTAGANTIWQGNLTQGTVLGYGASSTTQMSKVMTGSTETGGSNHGILFGNWADLYVGLFGALEFVVDPYSAKKKAVIEVTTFQMGDLLARHGESFSKAVNAIVS